MLNHAILNEENQCRLRNNQLLLYVRGKKGVEKSRIVNSIHLGFTFLKRQKELLIAALTGATTANNGNTTIYESLSINDCIQKQQRLAINIWQNRLVLILDKISIVSLKLLSIVDMRLSQAKGKIKNDIAVLIGLDMVIVIGDFYQFPPMIQRSL